MNRIFEFEVLVCNITEIQSRLRPEMALGCYFFFFLDSIVCLAHIGSSSPMAFQVTTPKKSSTEPKLVSLYRPLSFISHALDFYIECL